MNNETPQDDLLQIDEHRLDRECSKLPSQYRQAAFQAADTSQNIDELKAELRVAEAELRLKIRTTPGQFGFEKVTEGTIGEIVTVSPKVIALEKKIRDLDKKLALEKVLVTAMDYKKRAITNLVDLHVAGWHAEVRPNEQQSQALRKLSVSRSPAIVKKRRNQQDEAETD